MPIEPSDRDREIIWTLTRKVRVLTVAQLGRTWWSGTADSMGNARKRVRQLEQEGLLRRVTLTTHPELQLKKPVLVWTPGDAMPNFGAVSYRLQSRWTEMPHPTTAAIATSLATRRFGGHIAGRKPRATEATHDIHLSQIYLSLLDHSPKTAKSWLNDDGLYKEGRGRNEKLPDAIIRLGRGEELVIEFGGAYSKAKLGEFHEEMKHRAYEIW
jgi:hypothetical protein